MKNNRSEPSEGGNHRTERMESLLEIHSLEKAVRHINEGFSSTPIRTPAGAEPIPYHQLGSSGLERLCYQVLCSQGQVPRFFGRSGQAQYGIDLLVPDRGAYTVYQCKNVQDFSVAGMKKALGRFEMEWLGRPELPKPDEFVLCCPISLRDLRQNKSWTDLEQEFQKRTGIVVRAWDREYLDEQLRRLPDIVADLFSDELARRFCDLEDWNEDLFRPVLSASGEIAIDRYVQKKEAGQIYIEPKLAEEFGRKLEQNGYILILGQPGSGKTVTSLELANRFGSSSRRIYYLNMMHDVSEDTLVKGVRRRLSRPTIFVIDDCQGKYAMLLSVQNRLGRALGPTSQKAVVYIARTTLTPVGMPRGEFSSFVENLKQADAVLEFRPTVELYDRIVSLVKPALKALSTERLQKLFEITAHDLLLLDQLLAVVESPTQIDDLLPEQLFEETLKRYFDAPTVYRPGFSNLAALSQFNIAPLVWALPNIGIEDPKAAAQLFELADRPPRYFFQHSSAAELIARALAWSSGSKDYAEFILPYLVDFFTDQGLSDPRVTTHLADFLRNSLKLEINEMEEYRLKGQFLANSSVYQLIESLFTQLSLNTLAFCITIAKHTDEATFARYYQLVERGVIDGTLLDLVMVQQSSHFLKFLRLTYPSWHSQLKVQFAERGLRTLITTKDIRNVLVLLAGFADSEDRALAKSLDSVLDIEFEQMIQHTVTGTSISNIHWALRDLKDVNPSLLKTWEEKFGVGRYVSLLTRTGNFADLFRVIGNSSSFMSSELIRRIDHEDLDALLLSTINNGISISNLGWTLRQLKDTDPASLRLLEQRIGVERYLRLLVSSGTIRDLFKLLEYSSAVMAKELIEALDNDTLEILVGRTIDSGASIGTLGFGLRELRKLDLSVLEQLEQKVGVRRYLELLDSNGTVFELFRIIQYSTTSMAEILIGTLDDKTLDRLVSRTIATSQSIGTLSFTLRDLKKANEGLLSKLERTIGVDRWWKLISLNGHIGNIVQIMEYMDKPFRLQMTSRAHWLSMNEWKSMMLRGDLSDLALFIQWTALFFSRQFTLGFLIRLNSTFEELVNLADMSTLKQSCARVMKARDSQIKEYLLSMLEKRLTRVDISSLHFESFSEAVQWVDLLWWLLPTKRDDIAQNLFKILPGESVWLTDRDFIRTSRLLFLVLTDDRFDQNDVMRILTLGNDERLASLVGETATLDVFLYVWNLYCLWVDLQVKSHAQTVETFALFLNLEIRKSLADSLNTRFQSEKVQNKLDHLTALVGLIHAAHLFTFSPEEMESWSPKLSVSFENLRGRALRNQSFIYTAFLLAGIELLKGVVPARDWAQLLSKAEIYTQKTVGLNELIQKVGARALGSQQQLSLQ